MNQPIAVEAQAGTPGLSQPPGRGWPPGRRLRAIARHPVTVHLAVLVGYIAAGIVVTWPRATYLADGKLPATLDASSYVWDLWWMAHAVEHLSNPWTTSYMAAPVGTLLGLHTLMPLPGALLTPVTAAFGPAVAFNLLTIAIPGLLCYAMYRAARLWLPGQVGPIAAGGFFGLSAILVFQTWMHLNLAVGALFLPITLEAVIRLRRHPGFRQALVLGVVLGASMLTDQETAIQAALLAVAALLPWLLIRPRLRRLPPVGLAVMTALLVASPQLLAIEHETRVGGAQPRPSVGQYLAGIKLPGMFAPSPRIASWGLGIGHTNGWSTYGTVLSILAAAGLILAWRRRSAWQLALLWLGASIMAMGAVLYLPNRTFVPFAHVWDGVRVSYLMPFTWFVRIPGLVGFRTPARFAELGLVPAALLAGYTVSWVREHATPRFQVARVAVAVLLAAGLVEAGVGAAPIATMPAALTALDAPIAADHSRSVVLDIPFGLRGGVGITGEAFNPQTLVLAAADGHPLADAYLSRVPAVTATAIGLEPFYHDLMSAQSGHYRFTRAQLKLAAENAQAIHIGWVLLWVQNIHLENYLAKTGYRLDYQADGASVYRPAADLHPAG